MFKITSKDQVFFDLFIEIAENARKTSKLLEKLMTEYTNVDEKIREIETVEHASDMVVHRIMQQLNNSFITPIDREDICAIAKETDNIIDNIESTAHRFEMFKISSITPLAVKISSLIVKCTEELGELMAELKDMKKSQHLKKKIIEINRLEGEGDVLFREAITQLFSEKYNSIEVIQWKEIYEYLENTLDSCEDVADVIEGIVMKHS